VLSYRKPAGTLCLTKKLEPEVWPEFKRALHQAQLARALGKLPIGGSLCQSKIGDGEKCDLYNRALSKGLEPMIPKKLLCCLIELDPLLSESLKKLLLVQAANSHRGREP
jgi:hypothetical protein